MSQRPTIKKPTPLSAPVSRPGTDPIMGGSSDPVMGGVNIPQFTKDMQAEISPEAAPLWNFVTNHAPKIAAAVVGVVVICLAVAGWQWYEEKTLREAQGQLGRVISIQDASRRAAALEEFLAKAPSKLVNSAQLELATTAMELENFAKAAHRTGQHIRQRAQHGIARLGSIKHADPGQVPQGKPRHHLGRSIPQGLLQFFKQHVTQLLGRVNVKCLSRHLVNLGL